MARRLQPTLVDYVVIAINPALIMLLIGSLVFFLLETLYQGQYPARLHNCLSLFVFAAVLVTRISIEEGWDRALPFGAALAAVVALALHRFVSYQGTSLAGVGWLINYALMALIWWYADRLTWDCTLVDETQDASGEGLLQSLGFDRDSEGSGVPKNSDHQEAPAGSLATSATTLQSRSASDEAATTTSSPSTWQSLADCWQQFVERRRRPHAPGVWVVYFSLAALPVFGIGQAFIPAANHDSRRYGFLLFCGYAAAGLGLLLTTSFLNLRRYLRQRRLEMPPAMAGTWLTLGGALIVGLLLLTALLPRPNAEYSLAETVVQAASSEHDPSDYAVGREGVENQQSAANSDASENSQDSQSNSDETQSAAESTDKSRTGESSDSNDATDRESTSTDSDSTGDSQDQSHSQSSNQSGDNGKSGDSDSSQENQQPIQTPTQSNAESNVEQPSPSPPSPSSFFSGIGDWLATLFRWAFYGALILVAAWWSWRHRAELREWLQAMLRGWHEFWQRWLGQNPQSTSQEAKPVKQKSLADYPDPFANGLVRRCSAKELVRYSFEALEAWARDHGSPRDADQTPHEFARCVAEQADFLAAPARRLADLYTHAAYAPDSLPEASLQTLKSIWQALGKARSTLREGEPV